MIRVSADDGLPIYQQIVNQITYMVAANQLRPGEELTPIRTLAEQLLINPNTVARAYRELEVAGIVVKRGTAGTYIADQPAVPDKGDQTKVLHQQADHLVVAASQMGLGLSDLQRILKARFELLHSETKGDKTS